uniref:Uncharacterized protein n=1 Tax=Cannabis sativa TaxID=3483 RepID=A0A803NIT1_CANSA
MNVKSWNPQGLGNPSAFRRLHLLNNGFSLPTLTYLDYYGSDHRAIRVHVGFSSITEANNKKQSRVQFERIWLKEKDYADIISSCWLHNSQGDPCVDLLNSLHKCAQSLQTCHKKKFGQLRTDISNAQKRVNHLHTVTTPALNHSQAIVSAEKILDELLAYEEQYWQQRSRVEWLQLGDQNTKFFHAKVSARKSNNKIKCL